MATLVAADGADGLKTLSMPDLFAKLGSTEDGLSAAPDALLGEGTRQFLELFRGMVLGDEHR